MNIYLISEYVNRLRKSDIIYYAEKQGISLDKEEVELIYNYIKKDYKTIIYGNPKDILNEIKNAATATVEVVEMLGAEKNFYMICEGNNITGRFDTSCQAGPDDTVQIAFDMRKVHVFDLETQKTITN